jgi:hypothetical protein
MEPKLLGYFSPSKIMYTHMYGSFAVKNEWGVGVGVLVLVLVFVGVGVGVTRVALRLSLNKM